MYATLHKPVPSQKAETCLWTIVLLLEYILLLLSQIQVLVWKLNILRKYYELQKNTHYQKEQKVSEWYKLCFQPCDEGLGIFLQFIACF